MPLGYEVFAGNRHDATTLEEMVGHVEQLYGRAGRVWIMDRGLVSEKNVQFLRAGARRYILGTAKSSLRKFERELLSQDWKQVHEGLEVRLVPAPDGEEVFILCRSAERQAKEHAMQERFEKRIEDGLAKIAASCGKHRQKSGAVERRVGRLLERNTRAARLFDVQVEVDAQGFTQLRWTKVESWREWARKSEGCYLLRSNVTEWTPEELWRAYVQLTEAEAAFRVHKSDLQIRPVWHHREDRVGAHILVCFLAYVLWKTLAASCRQAGLGDEPRQVFKELSDITLVDVVLPTHNGVEIRKRCISQPTEHQRILLQRLGMRLPRRSRNCGSSVRCQWRSVQTETGLLQFWCIGTDNSAAFADRQDLIGLYLGETLDFLCRGPFHFEDFCLQSLSQAKVQPQVGLRHDAPAAMHFVDLRVSAGEDAHTRADRRAVALRSDELDLDPVLSVAAVVAQKRRQIIHIQNQGVHVAIVVVVAESC